MILFDAAVIVEREEPDVREQLEGFRALEAAKENANQPPQPRVFASLQVRFVIHVVRVDPKRTAALGLKIVSDGDLAAKLNAQGVRLKSMNLSIESAR